MPKMRTIYIAGIKIIYAIFPEKKIVFSGGSSNLSTTTLAGDIVEAISRREEIDGKLFSFFDFQTHSGFAAIPSGKFDFRKLTVLWYPRRRKEGLFHPVVDFWEWTECPPEILEVFSIFTESENPVQERRVRKMFDSLKAHQGFSIRC